MSREALDDEVWQRPQGFGERDGVVGCGAETVQACLDLEVNARLPSEIGGGLGKGASQLQGRDGRA